jgi:tetratricopeptide (TPR) repeat protein
MLAQIEKYLNNEMSLSERQVFENQLLTDEELVDELAFYTHVKLANQEIAREKRKAEFEVLRKEISNRPSGKIKPMIWISGIAASVILALCFWWFSHTDTLNPAEYADTYIHQHFENLPVKMDGNADSLQMGLRLFNEQKLLEAQAIFEDILQRKNVDSEAIKYAGITALRLKQFDKAIKYFQALSLQKNLYSNPGKFYEALALMQQQPIHKKEVEKLLNDVIDNNLEGNEEAREISKQLSVSSYQ